MATEDVKPLFEEDLQSFRDHIAEKTRTGYAEKYEVLPTDFTPRLLATLDAERRRREAAERYNESLTRFAEMVGIGPVRDEMVMAHACDVARAAWLATLPAETAAEGS